MTKLLKILCQTVRAKMFHKCCIRVTWTLLCLAIMWICCFVAFEIVQAFCRGFMKRQDFSGKSAAVCISPSCVKLASKLLQSIDNSVDPCQDFYRFTCGQYIKNAVIPEDKSFWGRRSEVDSNILKILQQELEAPTMGGQPAVFQKAKDFYHSCMDTATIEEIGLTHMKERLKMYGGWPVLEEDWKEKDFDWIKLTKTLAQAGQPYNLIIAAGLSVNETNVTQSVITLSPPDMGHSISIDSYYFLNGTKDPVTKAYHDVMVDIAVEFGANRTSAEVELGEVLNFEMQLADISDSRTNTEEPLLMAPSFKVSELNTLLPYLNWTNFLVAVLGDKSKFDNTELIQLSSPVFFKRLGTLLKKTPKRVLANYMLGQVMFSSKRHLTGRIDEINHKLLTARFSLPISVNRNTFCLLSMNTLLTPIMGAIFVQKHFSPESKLKASAIAKLIQNQLIILISEADWLDDVTRSRALNKIKKTQFFIGYPEELLNDTYLNEYYKQLQFNRSDFYNNILNINKFQRDQEIHSLHKRMNTSSWDRQGLSSVIEWMAYNMYTANGLDIYAGVLHGFYFDANRPLFLNIASLGAIIAHELTHSIDVLGSHINEDGNIEDWWEKETKLTFEKKAQTIVDEYSTYEVKELGIKLNAEIMRDEIIADHGGFKIARLALEQVLSKLSSDPRLLGFEVFSARQLFWIVQAAGWCENMRPRALKKQVMHAVHPPAEFRVNGPYRNSPLFAQDWECRVGSYMNPKKKVNVW